MTAVARASPVPRLASWAAASEVMHPDTSDPAATPARAAARARNR